MEESNVDEEKEDDVEEVRVVQIKDETEVVEKLKNGSQENREEVKVSKLGFQMQKRKTIIKKKI